VLKLVLAVPAALWTAGLFVGVLGFLAATDTRSSWFFRAALILLGISVVVACGALTVWLCMAALRQPTANARREALSLGASASTGAAEQNAAADGGHDPGF
jgi:cytochrome c biogenesis protein ResB